MRSPAGPTECGVVTSPAVYPSMNVTPQMPRMRMASRADGQRCMIKSTATTSTTDRLMKVIKIGRIGPR